MNPQGMCECRHHADRHYRSSSGRYVCKEQDCHCSNFTPMKERK